MTGCQRRSVSPSYGNLLLCPGSILDFQLPRSGLLARVVSGYAARVLAFYLGKRPGESSRGILRRERTSVVVPLFHEKDSSRFGRTPGCDRRGIASHRARL
jgi:hypothetical protein